MAGMLSLYSNISVVRNMLALAGRSIYRALMRSILMAISVVIGIAALVSMIGIGSGAKARVQDTISNLDVSRLLLSARLKTQDGRIRVSFPSGAGLSINDYSAIRHAVAGIVAVSPLLETSIVSAVTTRNRRVDAQVVGVGIDGFKLESRKLIKGTLFGVGDVQHAKNICVITEEVATTLFALDEPVYQIILIAGVPFRIVGVVGNEMSVTERGDLYGSSARVFIPYTSLLRRIDSKAGEGMKILMRVSSPELLPYIKQQVSDLMEQRRGKRKAEFAILSTAELAASYTATSKTLALLLAFVSAISLMVGGVGIANVMLISVTERTREIGVRIAVGARPADVQIQVLLEAIILSVIGGIGGVLVGLGVTSMVSSWNEWPFLITPEAVLGSFMISIGVGVLSGYYPARRAALLNPVEALRSS